MGTIQSDEALMVSGDIMRRFLVTSFLISTLWHTGTPSALAIQQPGSQRVGVKRVDNNSEIIAKDKQKLLESFRRASDDDGTEQFRRLHRIKGDLEFERAKREECSHSNRDYRDLPVSGPSSPSHYEPLYENMGQDSASKGAQGEQGKAEAAETTCTLDAVYNLEIPALITYLKNNPYIGCIKKFIWEFDAVKTFQLFTLEKVVAVSNEILKSAPSYDGTPSTGMLQMLYFIHTAGWHNYDNPIYDQEAALPALVAALDELTANTHLLDINDYAEGVLLDALTIMWNRKIGYMYIGTLEKIIAQWQKDPAALLSSYSQRVILFEALDVLRNGLFFYADLFAPAFGSNLAKKISWIALYQDWGKHYYLANNAIWVMGLVLKEVDAQKGIAISTLNDVVGINEDKLNSQYIWAMKALSVGYDKECFEVISGAEVCLDDVKEALKKKLFTHHYTYNAGKIVFDTPLDKPTIDALYFASQVVAAQFFRITGATTPVPDDPNDSVIAIIYASRQDYEDYQPFLFDLDTDNGGIYIEQDGTFYTYQRKPEDSVYSLEELFRHEYTHYLDGRYIKHGMWGETPYYAPANKLLWYSEGLAEFLAHASIAHNVQPRQIMVKKIVNDGSNVMTIQNFMTSTSGFKVYRYAALFYNYLYDNNMGLFQSIIGSVLGNKVKDYEALVVKMGEDAVLSDNYFAYIDTQKKNVANLTTPATMMVALEPTQVTNSLVVDNLSKIKTEVKDLSSTLFCTVEDSAMFVCKGTSTGTAKEGSDWGWEYYNDRLNDFLLKKSTSWWKPNWSSASCYMGPVKMIKKESDNKFYPLAEITCTGRLCTKKNPCEMLAAEKALFVTSAEGQVPCDDDLSGTIKDVFQPSGYCKGSPIPGKACNDGFFLTGNDTFNEQGVCSGNASWIQRIWSIFKSVKTSSGVFQ